MVRKIVGWSVVIFLIWWIASGPTAVSNLGHQILNAAHNVATSAATFLSSL